MRVWVLAAAVLVGAGALAQPEGEGPEAFVRSLYRGYQQPDFNVFARPSEVFAAPILEAMAQNDRCTPEGEVGAVDFDPLCQCQDPSGMTAQVGEVRRLSADRAEALVTLAWAEPRGREPLEIDLVKEGGGWRIADLRAADTPSFLEHVRAANRQVCPADPR